MAAHYEVRIGKDGKINLEGKDFKGTECLNEEFERLLGTQVSQELKPEYHAGETQVVEVVNVQN